MTPAQSALLDDAMASALRQAKFMAKAEGYSEDGQVYFVRQKMVKAYEEARNHELP